ncbi:MAG TPA: sigma-70 family RNA polymerase sigma factor [Candidatus Binataceae bacterium]|jgi:RNA polymerase sigma-70 factor (ECF subfamily)
MGAKLHLVRDDSQEMAQSLAKGGDLLARLRRGDIEAAREFYSDYEPRVFRFIAHALGRWREADAEDLTQETFIAVAEAIPSFRGDCSLLTFVCSIAHRKVASFIRRNRRREALLFRSIEGDEPSRLGVEDAAFDGIQIALGALTVEYREILMLKYVEDASVAEIAGVLEISQHAAESRLARARRAIRRECRKLGVVG